MSSIEKVFKDNFIKLCVFAYPLVQSEELAKDMVQDAFVVYSQKEDMHTKPDAVIKSFLYSTVKNICLNYIKREQIGQKVHKEVFDGALEDPNYLESIIKAEIIGELHHEISFLPEKCQHICKLIYFENKSYEEVSNELGVSINTVKTHRQRALHYLKSKFLLILLMFFI